MVMFIFKCYGCIPKRKVMKMLISESFPTFSFLISAIN